MPIPYIPEPIKQEPMYHAAPLDVDNYLRTRGWYSVGNCLWEHNDSEIGGAAFQWPEALAYEIFKNFVMLKTPSE